jgi:hypothetical protein
MTELAELGVRLDGPCEQRVRCPQCDHGPRDRALGVNLDTGAYHCFRCGWKGRAGGQGSTSRPIARIDDPSRAERKRERLRLTWRETVPLEHPGAHAVCRYLEARALGDVLENPPRVLRAHPGLTYWDGTTALGQFPAMVALFHGAAGEPVTLHVTYLRGDGCAKAPVPSPKKILGVPQRGATRGGAVRLFPVSRGVLGVSEGIETALSLHLIRRIPTWASFCADNLERMRLPEGLRELQIGIDIDESGKGRAVAEALTKRVRRWSRRTKVWFITPELGGPGDLNDELRRRAG